MGKVEDLIFKLYKERSRECKGRHDDVDELILFIHIYITFWRGWLSLLGFHGSFRKPTFFA